MHLEAHAILGWALGNLPGGNPQIRRYCTLGAVLPDLDGIGFFLSSTACDVCHQCGRGSNLDCTACGRPTCLRHTRLRGFVNVVCDECARSGAG